VGCLRFAARSVVVDFLHSAVTSAAAVDFLHFVVTSDVADFLLFDVTSVVADFLHSAVTSAGGNMHLNVDAGYQCHLNVVSVY